MNPIKKEKKVKFDNIVSAEKLGGVSDMSLIEEFFLKYKNKITLYDLLDVINDSSFDTNINVSSFHFDQEYEFMLRIALFCKYILFLNH